MKKQLAFLFVVGFVGSMLNLPASSSAAMKIWAGDGIGADSATGRDLNRDQNWSPNTAPGAGDDALIIFDRKQSASSDAAPGTTADFSVQNLTISNLASRVDLIAHTDTLMFTNTTTISSNLVVGAMGGANNYALSLTFNNSALSVRNVMFNGAQLGSTAGRSAVATLTLGGASSVTSNLVFTGNTGLSTLNISGATTIGRDLLFLGGAGTNVLNITAATIVSNNVAILNSTGSASNRFVLVNELRIGGNFSNTTANANKAAFQAQTGVMTFIGGASRIQTVEVASVGTAAANNYLIGTVQVGNSAGGIGRVRLVDGFVNNSGGSEQLLANDLRIFSGGTLDINGLSAAFQSGTNAGTVVGITTAGRGLEVSTQLDSTGTIVMGGGSILGTGIVRNAGTISGNGAIVPRLQNTGTVDVSGGTLALTSAPVQNGRVNIASSGTLSVAQSWANAGILSLSNGLLATTGTLTNLAAGLIEGNGTITGSLVNKGTLSPGLSVGALTIDNLTLEATSTLTIELASLSSFDSLSVTGSAVVGGTLNVDLMGGYLPNSGDSWVILTSGSGITGSFDSITAGYVATIVGNDLVLRAIPEPSALTLVGAGMMLLMLLTRRHS